MTQSVEMPPDVAEDELPTADVFAKGLLIRRVEERLLELFAEGKLYGTVHTCIGQELCAVAVAGALEPEDLVFSNHRCHGHFLARTGNVGGLIAEVMGKQSGVCGGRGGSQHLCHHGFFSNGVQGGIVPVATGMALSQKLRGQRAITAAFIGEGTLGEGAVYESFNIMARWGLPVLVVLENNRYSQSTPQHQTLAGEIPARAAAFGIRTATADTWHPAELLQTARDCADYVRSTGNPAFLQIQTYRLKAHSKGDDDRDPAEVREYLHKDPLYRFEQERPEQAAPIRHEVEAAVMEASGAAERDTYPCQCVVDETVPEQHAVRWKRAQIAEPDRMVLRIRAALEQAMRRDPRIFALGEDIEDPYGGAFKVTKGLSTEFPGRVRNTPISEAAIVGVGNGLALQGFIPMCEIMFGDFLALAADQIINHASKFRYMYNDQVRVPLIIRTPMGGRRGYGPTHSQCIEKHFLGLPGTHMVALHPRLDPAVFYEKLFNTIDRPTIVIENKLLYTVKTSDQAPDGFVLEHSDEHFPCTRLRPEGKPDVTILCYGGSLPEVERAIATLFDEHEIICEVICPLQLYPLNPWPIIESVQASGRLLTVEEGQSFSAFGAEAIAQIMESRPGLACRVARVAAPRHPIPSCGPLEKMALPGAEHVIAAARGLMDHE